MTLQNAVTHGVILCASDGGDCTGRKNGRLFPLSVPFLSLFRPFEGRLKARYLNFLRTCSEHRKLLVFSDSIAEQVRLVQ